MIDFITSSVGIQAVVFAGTTALVLGVLTLLFALFDPRLRNRWNKLDSRYAPSQNANRSPLHKIRDTDSAPGPFAASLLAVDTVDRSRLETRFLRAGIQHPQAVSRYVAIQMTGLMLSLATLTLIWLLGVARFDIALLAGGMLGTIATLGPYAWLQWRITKRSNILRRSLADFLDLFVPGIEAGMPLQSVITFVSRELRPSHPELAAEFLVCDQQVQLGWTLESATADLAQRTGVDDLRSFHLFVQQSVQFGSTLGSALRNLPSMLRAQRQSRAEELAQKASVTILIPTLLFIFPAVFVVLVGPAAIRIQESMSGGIVSARDAQSR